MQQLRNLGTALAALALLAACTDDDSTGRPATSSTEREPAANTTSPAPDHTILGQSNVLGPGRWGVTAFGDPDAPVAVFDVPQGFQGHESWVWTDEQGPREFAQLAYWAPARVFVDPCNVDAVSPPLGPTAQDLAAALAAQKRTTTTKPIAVTMDGHEGLYLELSTPHRFDHQACGPDGMEIWEVGESHDRRALEESVIDRYWILEVEGQRVVISALTEQAATGHAVDLVTDVVETIDFVDPA